MQLDHKIPGVIKDRNSINPFAAWLAVICLVFAVASIEAAVLPEDRTDLLYHSYSGGGVTIDGPSLLVRKGLSDSVSVIANYYVDTVSSASIDVVSTASAYDEERTETSIGVDYLHDKTLINFGYTGSEENDYSASSFRFSISQDFFGDLTNLSIGYSQGSDEVGKTGDLSFKKDASSRNYQFNLSQILTKNLIVNTTFETITNQGFLNNPYRTVRYLDASVGLGYSYEAEKYPETRTSDAIAIRMMYYLQYRASLMLEYRYFTDTWNIEADNVTIRYTHPVGEHWIFETNVRVYSQTGADFYSDLYAYSGSQTFLARDKELSAFSSQRIGFGVTYQYPLKSSFVEKISLNLKVDHLMFDYDDFRNVTAGGLPGQEPLYSFSANVVRFFFSAWY
ncbi:MAG: DUF3570 domain-containing protein [Pseudomonadales bacterium]|nr:DUF3570 domain-containing protein [Pseudomonadales bacterium]